METFMWLALLVLFILAETATVSMVSTWFAVGSLAALIAALLGAKLWLQITLFVVVSAGCLALLRPLAKKHFNPRITRTNVDLNKSITRLQVAQLLSQGLSYQKISDRVDVSTATIGRVSKCLNYGPGGYKATLKKLEDN